MFRLALLAALCAAIPLCADDPPKKLTPEERRQHAVKWLEQSLAGGKAYQAGQFDDARKALEEALRLARVVYPTSEFPDGHVNLAASLNNLAALYRDQGKLAEAEPLLKDALDMTRRLFKGDHPDLALGLNNLASLYHAQGKLAEAELLFKAVLDMQLRLFKGDHPDVATSLNNLAGLYLDQKKWSEAEPRFKDALAMWRRLFKGDHPGVATSLGTLATVYRDQGRLADAEPLAKESLEMKRRLFTGDRPDLAKSLNNLAALYQAQGKLSEAEPLFKDALAMRRRLFKGDHLALAESLGHLAALYLDQGKFAEAEPLLEGALEMNRRLFQGNHPDVASSLNNLAILYHAQGKLADAESLVKDALEMRRRLFKGDHPDLADSLCTLAILYHAQGKLADAEPLVKDALEMTRRLFKGDHPDLALGLNNVAFLYKAQGKLAEAERLYKDALEMRKRLVKGDHPDVATSLSNLAGLYQAQGKFAEAEPLFKDALATHRRSTTAFALDRSEGDTLTLVASLPGTLGGFLSVALQAKSAPAAAYPEVWAQKATVSRIYERRKQAARAVTDPQVAKLVVELTETRRRRAELVLAPETRDPATRKQREEQLKAYEKRITELDRGVRPLLPAVDRVEKLGKATVADLQKALPADAAVVDFLSYPFYEFDNTKPVGQKETNAWRYTAFVITKDKLAWVDLDTADKIVSAVSTWRKAITSGKEIPEAVPAKVRELVWERVRKELPANIKTVYIAPDMALCRVPWGALPGDKSGTILLEDFAIATIPHAPFLLDKLWPQDPVKNPPSGALVVGGVNFDAEATAGLTTSNLPIKPGTKAAWQALPGAAAEATGVESAAKKKGTVTTLKGEAATPAAVLAALPKAKHAHFATHGFFADPSFRSAFQLDEKDFLESRRGERIGRAALSPLVMTGLVFAGANNPKTPGRGIVTGEALVDLDLSGLELAVLSACETGLGDVAGGEGTFGLQRAFHLAGTRDVVASLWKVPDAPTAALMAEFYRNLWDKNLSPLAALREAQLFIYRNPGKIAELAAGFRAGFKEVKGDETAIKPTADGKAHPKQWAAFTLSGPGR